MSNVHAYIHIYIHALSQGSTQTSGVSRVCVCMYVWKNCIWIYIDACIHMNREQYALRLHAKLHVKIDAKIYVNHTKTHTYMHTSRHAVSKSISCNNMYVCMYICMYVCIAMTSYVLSSRYWETISGIISSAWLQYVEWGAGLRHTSCRGALNRSA